MPYSTAPEGENCRLDSGPTVAMGRGGLSPPKLTSCSEKKNVFCSANGKIAQNIPVPPLLSD